MQLTRRGFALCALAGVAATAGCAISPHRLVHSRARNLLLLIIDDLNDWVTALGDHPQVRAPNIQTLAASGTAFANAHSQAPICGPSRASFLSGLYPAQTGIYGQISDARLGPAVAAVSPTKLLPQYLRTHGYYAGGAGKVTHQGGQDGMFDEYLRSDIEYGPSPEKRFKWFDPRTHTDWGAYPDTDAEMRDFQTATWGTDFLARQADRPFMLTLGFVRPHVPWYVPQRWLDMFPLDEIELPVVRENDLDDVPFAGRSLAAVPQMPTLEWAKKNEEWRPMLQGYLASIAFADHCVGIALDGLRAHGHADNTLVCLISDNGYHMGEKQRFAKMSLWARSTRVPMIFAGPGVKRQVVTDPVGLIDIYPTVLDMLGLPSNPENAGRSLAPVLTDGAVLPLQPQVSVYGEGNYAVVDQRWRYIRYADGSQELYDHQNDPMEWHNLAGRGGLEEVKARLASYIPASAAADIMR
ncbi:sulfatase [Altererythrobacter sp. GH1-8]|uniref:sulfatase n=1 Tax=Altererythrobacter sp. GH1-8 TaxID=3349333 RepID=UPI00374D9737